MAKLTTEEFIKKARGVHGDKYDYSKVEYVNTITKICVICKNHGDFWVVPEKHIHRHQGCPVCSYEEFRHKKTKTQKQFIEEAMRVHGDKYDYSRVEYVNSQTPVEIICPLHGVFVQKPNNHLRGNECPQCSREKQSARQAMSQDVWLERANHIHGNKYNYSKVKYVNNHTPITIICPIHGEFTQIPAGHIAGQGCPVCGMSKSKLTQEEARRRISEKLSLLPYEIVEPFAYKGDRDTNVTLHCKIHDFTWTTSWHQVIYAKTQLSGGCPGCRTTYSKEVCYKAALKCQYRSEFAKKFKGEYFAALRNGWLDEICSHMIVVGNHYKRCIYAYEFPNVNGKNYVYVGLTDHIPQRDLVHGRKGAVYSFCKKHNLERPMPIQLTEYIDKEEAKEQEGIQLSQYVARGWLPLNRVKTGSLGGHLENDGFTFEECKAIGQKYNKRSEWKKNDYPTYYIASKRGWINDILEQGERFGNAKQRYWTEERIAETALKFETRKEFQKNEPSAYARAWKMGILDKVCGHMKRIWYRLDYDVDMIKRKMEEYDTLSDFVENNKSMRAWLSRHNINLKELTDKPYRKSKQDHIETENRKEEKEKELLLRNLSTLELIKKEIEKYKTLSVFIASNKTMCGWLTKHKMKLRDISDKPYKKREGPSKPVHQFTLDGVYVRSYKNARETERYGFNYKNVSQVCHGEKKSHKGYVFRFEK